MRLAETVTLPPGGVESLPDRDRIRARLEEARERTLSLVAPLAEADLDRQHSSLVSPLAWDLGHIAAFEDLWLSRSTPGAEPLRPALWDVYDATETPRAGRGDLAYLPCAEATAYLGEVHERALGLLERADLSPGRDSLHAGGYVWDLLIEHEHQHNETMLQAMQLAPAGTFRARPAAPPAACPWAPLGSDAVRVEAGPCPIGADGDGFAYDNERPRHEVEVAAFEIDRTPVTAGAYRAWIEDGGYRRPEWWSPEGWSWRRAEGAERPLFWTADGRLRRFDAIEPIDPSEPVMHVSWFEADAFARAHGRRLPTEVEWEKAATWDRAAGRRRRLPWGDAPVDRSRANVDVVGFAPAPVGAYPDGASAYGVLGLLGDAWEWTASDFSPYPGFRAHPYPEYSEVFFGRGLKVLRGGSWATRPPVARPTFRNWDLPQRRQLFAGFRCAADA
ncbi:MAG: ergothioneine biosynthesis protein EgtB [Actinomycetota bacterium]|nr:ergothioneine biosynthesis protein EgtB [Actinomycetota bacterium]